MNTPHTPQPPQRPWVEEAKRLLDESAEHLDGASLSRLNRARQAALGQRRRLRREWLPVGFVGACTMLLALLVAHGRHNPAGTPEMPLVAHGATATNDVDLVSGDDSLEFYQDLEFYAWLEAQDPDLGS